MEFAIMPELTKGLPMFTVPSPISKPNSFSSFFISSSDMFGENIPPFAVTCPVSRQLINLRD